MKCKFYGKVKRVCSSCGLQNDCIEIGCQMCGSPISKDEKYLTTGSGGICISCLENADGDVLRGTLLDLVDEEYTK